MQPVFSRNKHVRSVDVGVDCHSCYQHLSISVRHIISVFRSCLFQYSCISMVIRSIFVYLVNLINLWHQFPLYHLFFFHLSIDLTANHSQFKAFSFFFLSIC